MTRFQVEVGEVGGLPMLELRGEFDIAGVDLFEEGIAQAGVVAGALVLVDLRDVTFLDSSGLRALLAADARTRADGRRLVLVRGPEPVHRVFELALLDRRLRFVETPEEALALDV